MDLCNQRAPLGRPSRRDALRFASCAASHTASSPGSGSMSPPSITQLAGVSAMATAICADAVPVRALMASWTPASS